MADTVLTADAVDFLTELQRDVRPAARELLAARHERAQRLRDGELPDFLPETQDVRDGRLARRAGPGGAAGPPRRDHRPGRPQDGDQRAQLGREDVHGRLRGRELADLGRTASRARSTSPTRSSGRSRSTPARSSYSLNDETATLLVRPRGWHLAERHFEVDGAPISASLFDFGLYFFRNHACGGAARSTCRSSSRTSRRGSGTTSSSGRRSGSASPHGTIKATVLIETILAAFEMEEILYELREHSAGLNAGAGTTSSA